MRLKYNAPATLSFAIVATAILVLDQYLAPGLIHALFTAPGKGLFKADDPPSYFLLISHVLGHADWDHLLSNLTLILLLGPILEEKYGSRSVAGMILLTALANGLVNALFFPTELMGSSGIAFMMILLVSFANVKEGEWPLTFFLVVGLYLAKEFINIFRYDDVSQISHIIGGACGGLFGFIRTVSGNRRARAAAPPPPPPSGGRTIVS